MMFNCPGSQRFKQSYPETVNCHNCGEEIEIWTDEFQTICPKCKKPVKRQEGQSCLDWCRYAKECVGGQLYKDYMQNKSMTMKDILIKELESYFGSDAKRIAHSKNVMKFAEDLLQQERGDWHIVIPASILHDVGIKAAEKNCGSSAGYYQEKEGPAIARNILLKLGFKKEDMDEICQIIAHHHRPGELDTQNFKILYDADRLLNLKDEVDIKDKFKLSMIIDKAFLTDSGRKMARKIYLGVQG